MQFVKDGPDVPDRLIQAHEDGRVVFFCGAGISVPAGLPGFRGLIDKLYGAVGETPNRVEQRAMKEGQYDTAMGLLEKRLGCNRARARSHLLEILKPESQDSQTHQALLTLSCTRGRQPRCRLVTTNFDRLFEVVREPELPVFQAPCLPPAKARWHGLVYLHGLLPEETTGADAEALLDQLVLSSGDFGLAYLSEGWAARFVAELFRSFTVCFVGYSISDPVLRYMMDALAADGLRGESGTPEAFAFASHSPRQEKQAEEVWKAKNVTPILYHLEDECHSYLHQTLYEWSTVYRDGVLGKERMVGLVAPWLQPKLEASHLVLNSLVQAGLCGRFPADALSLLHAAVDPRRGSEVGPAYLSDCLDAIERADPALAQDHRMRYLRRIY